MNNELAGMTFVADSDAERLRGALARLHEEESTRAVEQKRAELLLNVRDNFFLLSRELFNVDEKVWMEKLSSEERSILYRMVHECATKAKRAVPQRYKKFFAFWIPSSVVAFIFLPYWILLPIFISLCIGNVYARDIYSPSCMIHMRFFLADSEDLRKAAFPEIVWDKE